MDVIRRNTDYALRMMVNLAAHYEEDFISAKTLAIEGNFSYQLGCKLLQKLHKAKLVKSSMGNNGGFMLAKRPAKINLADVIKAIQGEIRLNRCLLGSEGCENQSGCEISTKLAHLQSYIDKYLSDITLAKIISAKNKLNK